MEPTEQLASILPALSALVDRIGPTQLNNPTPCAKFTVHDVLDHMIVLGGSFSYLFRGQEAPDLNAPPAYGVVPAAEFRSTIDDLLAAVQSPGAMTRVIAAPIGDVLGATFARFVAFDGLVHGWDLATATSLHYEIHPAVIDSVDEFARQALTPEMRDGDTFKQPTTPTDDASQLQRLIAFSGRSL
jgi:uncharacterized protein (TIGR03086 family)